MGGLCLQGMCIVLKWLHGHPYNVCVFGGLRGHVYKVHLLGVLRHVYKVRVLRELRSHIYSVRVLHLIVQLSFGDFFLTSAVSQ